MKNILLISINLLILCLLSGCIHTYPDADAEDPTLVDVRLRLKFPESWDKISHIPARGSKLAADPDLRIVVSMSASGKNIGLHKTFIDRDALKEDISITLPFQVRNQEHILNVWVDYSDTEADQGRCYDISNLSSISYIHPHGERKAFDDCFTATCKWRPDESANRTSTEVILQRPNARFRLVAQDYSRFIQIHDKEIRRGESYFVKISYKTPVHRKYDLLEDLPVEPLNDISFSSPLEILTIEGVEVELASDLLFVTSEQSTVMIDLTVLNSALMPVASISGIEIPLERGKITTITGKLLTNLLSTGITIDNEWGEEVEIIIDDPENESI